MRLHGDIQVIVAGSQDGDQSVFQAAHRDSPANQQLQLFKSLPEEKYDCACGCGMAGHRADEERRYLKRAVSDATRKRPARNDTALKEECRRLAEAEEIERLAALAREAQAAEA